MWTVDGFCCFGLETFGKIVGWLGVLGSGFVISIIVIGMVYLSNLSCYDIRDLDHALTEPYTRAFGLYDCESIFGAYIVILTIVIAIYILSFVIYFLLLRGISNQNHKQIVPVLVVEALGLVYIVLKMLLNLSVGSVIGGLIMGSLNFYSFTALYSLYIKIKNASRRGVVNVQFNKTPNV
ncbi:uncharacterized protein [Chironomus tepperi]|uniref:uncharacterized protein n=1 Tax=Chironomus tepperi TaxID=113505 RepID=UPI00391F4885